MREKKFRIWDIETKEFFYWDITERPPSCLTKDYIKTNSQDFTGLTDKNGIEIYEGDIVYITVNYWKDQTSEKVISEIVWGDNRWELKTFADWKTQEKVFCYQGLCESEKTEVIGNIYETPNLA